MLFHQSKEVAHYYRFKEIYAGREYDRDDDLTAPTGPRLLVDWSAVYNIGPVRHANPSSPDGLGDLLTTFETTYVDLMKAIHNGFNGHPDALTEATQTMKKLDYQTVALMRVGVGKGETCAPPFWFVNATERTTGAGGLVSASQVASTSRKKRSKGRAVAKTR